MKNNLIINFHTVTSADWFERVIILLKSKYKLVELSFFEDSSNYKNNKGYCHITFDDGHKTFYTVVYPILKKHLVPATIFISPKSTTTHKNLWFQEVKDYDENRLKKIISKELSLNLKKIENIDCMSMLKCLPLIRINEIITLYQKETNTSFKPFQNMNLNEILEVEKSGLVVIGAHTMNHPILKNESDENCFTEISESISELQKLLGHKIKYFAYPNGTPKFDFGNRELNFLKDNNIVIGLSSETKFISRNDNKLSLPRIGLSYGSMRFVKLKLLLGMHWDKIKSLIKKSESKKRNYINSLLK